MPSKAVGMPCPIDGTALIMSERAGIEIDYCPTCRGVWLDRGELDKIVERSAQAPAAVQPPPAVWGTPGYDQGRYRKRKKSFLEELFD